MNQNLRYEVTSIVKFDSVSPWTHREKYIIYLLDMFFLLMSCIFFILGKKIDYLYFYRDSQLMKKWFTSRPGK